MSQEAQYVGAIDQGTTSTRFMIFDHAGHEVARHQLKHEQIVPQAGWVEHDPHEIWEATQDVIETALGRAGITADGLAAIGITSQRETTVVWDRRTGEPYYNAIVRPDERTDRVRWILENVDGVRPDAEAGHAILGGTDSWLIWWLTGGPDGGLHLTDVTNAGGTGLMDLQRLDWDDELLVAAGVPRSLLPEIRSSSELYGRTVEDGPFTGEVMIGGVLSVRQAALIGLACFEPGALAHGTDGVLLNTGTEIVESDDAQATVAYRFGPAPAVYALEGSAIEAVATAGPELGLVRVGGIVAADEQPMQRLADTLGVPVSRPVVAESATLGAAYAAGLAVGYWNGIDEIAASWHEATRWESASDDA